MQKSIIISLCFFMFACQNQKTTNQSEQHSTRSAVPVTVMRVQIGEIAESIRLTGDVRPFSQVDIFSKASGILQKEYVEIGQSVKKGEVLAEVQQDIPGMEFSPVKIEATQDGIVSQDFITRGRASPRNRNSTLFNTLKKSIW